MAHCLLLLVVQLEEGQLHHLLDTILKELFEALFQMVIFLVLSI